MLIAFIWLIIWKREGWLDKKKIQLCEGPASLLCRAVGLGASTPLYLHPSYFAQRLTVVLGSGPLSHKNAPTKRRQPSLPLPGGSVPSSSSPRRGPAPT